MSRFMAGLGWVKVSLISIDGLPAEIIIPSYVSIPLILPWFRGYVVYKIVVKWAVLWQESDELNVTD